jgi:hypothetical protein
MTLISVPSWALNTYDLMFGTLQPGVVWTWRGEAEYDEPRIGFRNLLRIGSFTPLIPAKELHVKIHPVC